jgi:transcriptional regulator with XRE-family HTH domain
VLVGFGHADRLTESSQPRQRTLPKPGREPLDGAVSLPQAAIAAALDQVGARLQRMRTQRGMSLTTVAAATGISKSTLSRLETGQRRPSLELLLPLAQAYRVPLEDLVGAPDVGDPRVRLKPRRVHGRTVLPLTRPGAIQAWKIVIPRGQAEPDPRAHDGFEWLYVLTGRLRLILGDRDLVLGPGEAVEFDTRVPHWFGSTGAGPVEILSIFGRPGERMHVHEAHDEAVSDG